MLDTQNILLTTTSDYNVIKLKINLKDKHFIS